MDYERAMIINTITLWALEHLLFIFFFWFIAKMVLQWTFVPEDVIAFFTNMTTFRISFSDIKVTIIQVGLRMTSCIRYLKRISQTKLNLFVLTLSLKWWIQQMTLRTLASQKVHSSNLAFSMGNQGFVIDNYMGKKSRLPFGLGEVNLS